MPYQKSSEARRGAGPGVRHETSYQVSERRACRALRLPRSTIRDKSTADPQTALRMRLRDPAMSRVGYGYRRLHVLIEREGWHVNHKRVYRLYREEGLAMKRCPPRRRKACLKREQRPLATEKNECWSMDLVSDELFDGRRIRLLTIVDNHTRESLAIHIGQRIRGCEVVEVRGPRRQCRLFSDSGTSGTPITPFRQSLQFIQLLLDCMDCIECKGAVSMGPSHGTKSNRFTSEGI
jgi:hypothetical protein